MATPSAAGTPRRRASQVAGRGRRIRWDRVGRMALLALLAIILTLYISPAKHWFEQSRTRSAQQAELHELEADNARLKQGIASLENPATLEQRARELGMVRQGERAYVIENPPREAVPGP